MSILDQLGTISGDVTTSTANSINNALGENLGGLVNKAIGISPNGNLQFFKPLDVRASELFHNLPPGNNRSFYQPLDVQASVLFSGLTTTLNIKGKSLSTDRNLNKYEIGFTPDVDFILYPDDIDKDTKSPVERGVLLEGGIIGKDGKTSYGTLRDTNEILNVDIPNAYNAFDDPSGEEFLHNLDHEKIPIASDGDIYLSSFVETNGGEDNEDPISFGYDVIINYANSPLFNGSIEDFIEKFSKYDEIGSRLDILSQFKKHFFKFFKIDSPNSVDFIDNKVKVRTYYLKKLVGLDNLSESILPEKSKQFINYGSNDDILTLTLNEDVSNTMGYLSALYKTLTWSKVHGKKMIPDNLLRFDMDIVVTESRKFNRVSKNSDDTIDQYADLISRYRYTVYECQFFFDKMSHGDSIDMWGLDTSQGFDIKLNYKFSTLLFEKFTKFDFVNNVVVLNYGSTASIDNSKVNLTDVSPDDTNKFFINNGKIELSPIEYSINRYSGYAPNDSENSTEAYKRLFGVETVNTYGGDEFSKKLANKHLIQKSNTLVLRDKLLEKTLINISENVDSGNGLSLRDALLDKTLDNISQKYKFSLSNLGGLLISKLNGGFTEDGYEYNIAAHYANKLINTTFDLLGKAVNPTIKDIYQAKVLFQESTLMEINNEINFLKNQLNGGQQKLNIYGDGKSTKLVYSGDNLQIDGPYTPTHNTGDSFNIYDNTKEESIPFHTGIGQFVFGPSSVPDIYDRTIEEPITPLHNTGDKLNIYNNTKEEVDTPAHHTGTTFNIYNNTTEEVDTPAHHTGSTFDIYDNTTEEVDTPAHHTGSTFDIYNNTTEEVDTPAHHTGSTFDIYNNTVEEVDTPAHHTGPTFDIYNNTVEEVDTPAHHSGATFDIYNNKKEYAYIPAHTTGKLLSIYGKK